MGQDVSSLLNTASPYVSIGGSLLGGGLGALGAISGGNSAADHAAFQANMLRQNATMAEVTANQIIEQGRTVAQERGLRTAQTIGAQRATYAGRGVEVDTGSALDVTLDEARIGKMDEIEIMKQAEREALGFRTRAYNFELEAQAQEARGKNAKSSGSLGATTSLLNTSASLADKWMKLADRNRKPTLSSFGNQRDEWDVLGR